MSAIRESARGEACLMRLPCCHPTPANETTVYCHINVAGVALKASDLFGFYGCFSCHLAYDKKDRGYDRDWLDHQALIAMQLTQERLLEKKLVRIEF